MCLKDWKKNSVSKYNIILNKYNIVTLHSFNKDQVKLQSGETFGAELTLIVRTLTLKPQRKLKTLKVQSQIHGEDTLH